MLDDMKTPFFEVQTSDNEEIEAQVKMYARLFKERLACTILKEAPQWTPEQV